VALPSSITPDLRRSKACSVRVIVETANGKKPGLEGLDKLRRGETAPRITGGSDNVFWLIQYDGESGVQPAEDTVVYPNGVLPPQHLGALPCDDLAVY